MGRFRRGEIGMSILDDDERIYWKEADRIYFQYDGGKISRETYVRRMLACKEKNWPTSWGTVSKNGPTIHRYPYSERLTFNKKQR